MLSFKAIFKTVIFKECFDNSKNPTCGKCKNSTECSNTARQEDLILSRTGICSVLLEVIEKLHSEEEGGHQNSFKILQIKAKNKNNRDETVNLALYLKIN